MENRIAKVDEKMSSFLSRQGWKKTSYNISGCNVWQQGQWKILKSFVVDDGSFGLCHADTVPASSVLVHFNTTEELSNIMKIMKI